MNTEPATSTGLDAAVLQLTAQQFMDQQTAQQLAAQQLAAQQAPGASTAVETLLQQLTAQVTALTQKMAALEHKDAVQDMEEETENEEARGAGQDEQGAVQWSDVLLSTRINPSSPDAKHLCILNANHPWFN